MKRKPVSLALGLMGLCLTSIGGLWLIAPALQPDPPPAESPFANWLTNTAAGGPASIPLAAEPYRHPSGAFAVRYPDGWQIDESEDTALFTAPDETAQFAVIFAAADPSADLPALTDSELRRAWGDLPNFVIDPIRPALAPERWSAAFSFDQAILPEPTLAHMRGLALYHRQNGWLFTQTFLARDGSPQALVAAFQSVAGSLQINLPLLAADSE